LLLLRIVVVLMVAVAVLGDPFMCPAASFDDGNWVNVSAAIDVLKLDVLGTGDREAVLGSAVAGLVKAV
jgi:hypothetical protein